MAKHTAAESVVGESNVDSALGTRERLLLAAERLIARDGVNHVSMREINIEAGARNLSAVHYHFGSLDGVITAIYDYRMGPVDRRRLQMLNELTQSKQEIKLQDIVHAVVWALAEQMIGQGSNHYVGFLAAIARAQRYDGWEVVGRGNRRGLVRGYAMVRRLLVSIPADVLHTRMILALREMMYVLADVELMIAKRHPDLRDTLVLFHTSDLVTRTSAALAAPVSEVTRMAGRVLKANSSGEKGVLYGIDAIWAFAPTHNNVA